MARPTKYSTELAESICQEIANSCKGVHEIATNQNITVTTVMRWLNENTEFRESYARAKELQAEFMAADIIRIADECREGQKTVSKEWGDEVTTGDMVERSRLMIDARKWLASKLAPKKYGDKLDITTAGEAITTKAITIESVSKD